MNKTNEKLVSWLFNTKAVRVCPQDKPFWYTSGTVGPYYINTHFLYGSEEKANSLLKIIDVEKEKILECPMNILEITKKNYLSDNVYKGLIDDMCEFIKDNIIINEINYISGGERRDWFFSLLIADLLNKPHITIYKDLTTVLTENGKTEKIKEVSGTNVLHIADLITEASSYQRAWIPAIRRIGAEIKWSVVVVDRKQGGEEFLESEGVKSFSMVNIDKNLFEKALSMELINKEQFDMVIDYIENPKSSMKNFIKEHPEFLQNALNSDEKSKERAQLCIDKKIYE